MTSLLFADCVGEVVLSYFKIVVNRLNPNRFFTKWVYQINMPGTELPLACRVCDMLAFAMLESILAGVLS